MRKKYRVFMIDIPGMGRSSRPDFDYEDHEEAELYFLSRINDWRESMGFDLIDLVGHSFGGFISARYALKYHDHIRKLLLLSPSGVVPKED